MKTMLGLQSGNQGLSASCMVNSWTSGMTSDLSLFPSLQNGVNSTQLTVQCGEKHSTAQHYCHHYCYRPPDPAFRTGWAGASTPPPRGQPSRPPSSQRTWCDQLFSGDWGVLPLRLQGQQLEQSDQSGNKVQDQQAGPDRGGNEGSQVLRAKMRPLLA